MRTTKNTDERIGIRRTKGQMEIMGLVVIVLLIMLGMMFALRFMQSGTNQRDLKAEFEDTQLAANMINAMLRTTTTCKGYTVTTLLQDCYTSEKVTCNETSGQKSCEYVKETMEYLLNETLTNRMNKRYHFEIDKLGQYSLHQKCVEQVSKFSPISVPGGTMIVKLDICTDMPTYVS